MSTLCWTTGTFLLAIYQVSGQGFDFSGKCDGSDTVNFTGGTKLAGGALSKIGTIPAGKVNVNIATTCTGCDIDIVVLDYFDKSVVYVGDASPTVTYPVPPTKYWSHSFSGQARAFNTGVCVDAFTKDEFCLVYSGVQGGSEYLVVPGQTTRPLDVYAFCYTGSGCEASFTYSFKGNLECIESGSGEFDFEVSQSNAIVSLGIIPKGFKNVIVSLEPADPTQDLDVYLVDEGALGCNVVSGCGTFASPTTEQNKFTAQILDRFLVVSQPSSLMTSTQFFGNWGATKDKGTSVLGGLQFEACSNSNTNGKRVLTTNLQNQEATPWQGFMELCYSGFRGRVLDYAREVSSDGAAVSNFEKPDSFRQRAPGAEYILVRAARKGEGQTSTTSTTSTERPSVYSKGDITKMYTPDALYQKIADGYPGAIWVAPSTPEAPSLTSQQLQDPAQYLVPKLNRDLSLFVYAYCNNGNVPCDNTKKLTGKVKYAYNFDESQPTDPYRLQDSCTKLSQPRVVSVSPRVAIAGSVLKVAGFFPMAKYPGTKFLCRFGAGGTVVDAESWEFEGTTASCGNTLVGQGKGCSYDYAMDGVDQELWDLVRTALQQSPSPRPDRSRFWNITYVDPNCEGCATGEKRFKYVPAMWDPDTVRSEWNRQDVKMDVVYCKVPDDISVSLIGTEVRVEIINVPTVPLDKTTGLRATAAARTAAIANPLCASVKSNTCANLPDKSFPESLSSSFYAGYGYPGGLELKLLKDEVFGTDYELCKYRYSYQTKYVLDPVEYNFMDKFTLGEQVDTLTFPGCMMSLAVRCYNHNDGIWQLRWTSGTGRLFTEEPCSAIECVKLRDSSVS